MKTLYLYSLVTLFSIPTIVFGSPFIDVDDDHRFTKEIEILKDKNIIKGYSDNSYKPESFVNRAELTKMVISSKYSSAEISRCDTNIYSFPDVNTDEWYAPYVCVAKKNNIIHGYRDGLFRPESEITLPETIKIIFEEDMKNRITYNSYLGNLDCADHNVTNKSSDDCNKYKDYYDQWFMEYISYFYKIFKFNLSVNFPKINDYNIEERDYVYNGRITKMDGKINLLRDYKISRGEMAFFIVESLYDNLLNPFVLTGEFVKTEKIKMDISDFQEPQIVEVTYVYLKNIKTNILLRENEFYTDDNGILRIDYIGDYNFSEKDLYKTFSFNVSYSDFIGQFNAKLINE